MNKRNLILLVLPALMLSGCNKEISAADAKAKAKEIEQHEVKAEDYKALSVSTKLHTESSGKMGGQTGSGSADTETVAEFSVDENYFHTVSYLKYVEGEETRTTDVEVWTYLKDGNFYVATRNGDKKTYVSVEGAAAAETAFKSALDEAVKGALAEASDKTYLEEVEAIADGKTEEGASYSVKYYTAGDGNLTVEGSATFTDYEYEEGVKASGSGKVKYAWDKYLLAEVGASMDLHAVDAESDTDVTIKMDLQETIKFEVKVSYPNLDEFQKGLL